jgi:hypothetical protein
LDNPLDVLQGKGVHEKLTGLRSTKAAEPHCDAIGVTGKS